MRFRVTRFGWLPELSDHRDQLYAAPVEAVGVLPTRRGLRGQLPPVYDQGQLGSCAANASAGVIDFDRLKQCFIVRNSRGVAWGIRGLFHAVLQLCDRRQPTGGFWIVRIVQ